MADPLDTQDELTGGNSKLEKYQALVVGRKGFWSILKYELITYFSTWVPGALGLLLRSKLYPFLLGECGRGVVFGCNVVLRHPGKTKLKNNIVFDDNSVIDAKGDSNTGIDIDDNVFVGRNTIIYCQNGDIEIGNNTNIGSNCQIFSAQNVKIGNDVLIAAYTYLVGGGHNFDDPDVPIIKQGRTASGINIGDNVWLGAGVKVLDGVSIGEGSIIAAGAVVTEDIPPFTIAGGIPAKVLKQRK
jgi:acetyltransferase-like isoleucine patch superfamily enzyme